MHNKQKINTIAEKKWTDMSIEELIEKASVSESEANKVVTIVHSIKMPTGKRNAFYKEISEIPFAAQNPTIRKYIFEFIDDNGLGGANIEILSNLLSYPPRDEDFNVLRSISLRHKDSIAPALIMTSKGCPNRLVDDIALKNGLVGPVLANRVETKRKMMNNLEMLFSNTNRWENERSAIFISQFLLDGRILALQELSTNMSSVPVMFLAAIATKGNKTQKELFSKSNSPEILKKIIDLQIDGQWPMSQGMDRNDLIFNLITNKDIQAQEKLKLFEKILPSLDNNAKKRFGTYLATINDSETFEKVLEMFESGEIDCVEEITGNLFFACMSYGRIMSIIEKRGLWDKTNPRFKSFIEKVTHKRY